MSHKFIYLEQICLFEAYSLQFMPQSSHTVYGKGRRAEGLQIGVLITKLRFLLVKYLQY